MAYVSGGGRRYHATHCPWTRLCLLTVGIGNAPEHFHTIDVAVTLLGWLSSMYAGAVPGTVGMYRPALFDFAGLARLMLAENFLSRSVGVYDCN